MVTPIPFLKHRFAQAAQHYRAGRTAYAPRLIHRVAQLTGLQPWHRVMDLGCGPGPLALAFAPLVREVVALDPEPAMLAEARAAAEADGAANIEWVEASSYDLGPRFGAVHLAAIGRAFHWMDRADTLRRLDALVEPGGTVALFGDTHPDLPENAWRTEWRALLNEHVSVRWRGPGWVRHEALLLDSPLREIEEISVIERRTTSADDLVARALSMSTTAASPELEAKLQALCARLAPAGSLTEIVTSYAILARRPEAA
jgi:SAM-dependent methyltransferase